MEVATSAGPPPPASANLSTIGEPIIVGAFKGQTFKNDRYVVIENLVETGSIKSYLVEDREEGRRKLLKTINNSDVDKDFFRNIDILKRHHSDFIINYYNYFKVRFNNYIVMEYFEVRFDQTTDYKLILTRFIPFRASI